MIILCIMGIIGVYLWGWVVLIDELQVIVDEYGLKFMFDVVYVFGSIYKGQIIGRFGVCEVFSFYVIKVFNIMEGGVVVINDDELVEVIQLMCNFGFKGYDNVIYFGMNGKMIEVCVVMGLVNFELFDEVMVGNKQIYWVYCDVFCGVNGVIVLEYFENEVNSYYYVVIEVDGDFVVFCDWIIFVL